MQCQSLWSRFFVLFKEKVTSHFRKLSENRGGGDNPHLILWVQFNSNMKSLLLTMISFCSQTEAVVIGTMLFVSACLKGKASYWLV